LLTNVAVETAARDAGDCGYNAIGVEDACAAYTELEHSESMNSASWWVSKSTSFVVGMLDGALGA
jgi:nicotinamidase-related amidase